MMLSLKAKALYFLSKREYGYKELLQKLQRYGAGTDEIRIILDELVTKKYLSEERYITNYLLHSQAKFGLRKIKYELSEKISNLDLIDVILAQNPVDEFAAALSLWQRKFNGIVAQEQKEIARQVRYLQSKGFGFAIISKIVRGISEI